MGEARKRKAAGLPPRHPRRQDHDSWRVGDHLHAHTYRCLVCQDPRGDSFVNVEVRLNVEGRLMLIKRDIGSRLCPDCKPDYLPLTPERSRKLDDLCETRWQELSALGCPCCEAGLIWFSGWHLGPAPKGEPA
jgi:hypothetical protein